ncbi:MAG: DotI/IcmL family type IV secretion protein [Tatlockia sp.]|jgi:hypothetical protein
MIKSRLCAGLLSFLSATAFATESQPANPTATPISTETPATVAPAAAVTPVAPATTPASTTQTETPAPADSNAATPPAAATPTAATPATATPAAATATAAKPLDCNYHIPAETTHIDQTVVLKWAQKAAVQSFDFDHTQMDKQLTDLKACYTDLGWQGFNDALQKSGNLNAIKSQQLTVSSMMNGEAKITEVKDNQWKLTLPLQVVYQNAKEKLTQPLTVNLVVGRKTSGDLGIMQMIAIPQQQTTTPAAAPATQPQ